MPRSREFPFDLVRNLFLPFTASIALPLLFIDPALADRKLGEQQLASRPEPTTVPLSRWQWVELQALRPLVNTRFFGCKKILFG